MQRVCSLDVAQVMMEQKKPLTVNQLVGLLQQRRGYLPISRSHVSSIVRNFVGSPGCTCIAYKESYPHKYHMLSVDGYIFRVRKNNPVDVTEYPLYLTCGSPRIIREEMERKEKVICEQSRQFSMLMRNLRPTDAHATHVSY